MDLFDKLIGGNNVKIEKNGDLKKSHLQFTHCTNLYIKCKKPEA